jgi:nicotinamide riboside kinase
LEKFPFYKLPVAKIIYYNGIYGLFSDLYCLFIRIDTNRKTNDVKIYVLTGPESSGKTSLAKSLSAYYDVNFVAEYSRIYLEINGAEYNHEQVLEMAKGQVKLETRLKKQAQHPLIYDTDLLTYKIWYNFKYGIESKYVNNKLKAYQNRFYFLCSPDFQWHDDELRENPADQWEIFDLYKENLLAFGFDFAILEGDEKLRFKDAIAIIGEKSK